MDAAKLRTFIDRVRTNFTGGQIAIVAVLSVLALLSTFAFLTWVSQPSYRPLLSGGTTDEAKDVVASLDSAGIAYKLSSDGTSVMVKANDLGKARLSVDPSSSGGSKVVGLELFDKQSFTSSDFQQRVGYQRALQGELTRAILKIKGLNSATVQLAMAPERVFTQDQQATRASVLVGSTGNIAPETVQSIVSLVSAAVPGLDAANVIVTDTRGKVLTKAGVANNDDNTQLTENYELQLSAKAESMLAQAFGAGRVLVRVTAELNFDKLDTETTTYQPNTATAVRSSETTEKYTGTGTPPNSGTIGVEGSLATGSSTGTTNDYSRGEKSTESVLSSTVEKSSKAAGAVQRLSAAAVVDSSLSPAPNADQVKQLIAAAIGANDTRGDTVVVQAVNFGEQSGANAVQTGSSAGAGSSPITGYISTGIGALLLLLVAFFLRRGLRTTTETIDVTDAALAAGARSADGEHRDTVTTLPGELRLIDSEPDELASLLRSWVADRREVPR
jgi:flagellar M-ring protein FliF